MLWPLAQEAGYFDKYALNVTLQYIQGSGTAIQALIANEIQMVQVAGSVVASARTAQQDLVTGVKASSSWRPMDER